VLVLIRILHSILENKLSRPFSELRRDQVRLVRVQEEQQVEPLRSIHIEHSLYIHWR
jgi:hypothetical protein